jgi:hypothetical protein
VEVGSGHGLLSMQLAKEFPNATVVSLEESEAMTSWQHQRVEAHGLWNNLVCNSSLGETAVSHLFESPELARFLVLRWSLPELLAEDRRAAGKVLGMLVSSGLTSFATVPTPAHASLALAIFARTDAGSGDAEDEEALEIEGPTPLLRGPAFLPGRSEVEGSYGLQQHPWAGMGGFQLDVLRQAVRVPSGRTHVLARGLRGPAGQPLPWVRMDVLNMTRNVHHHFDYRKDGHTRTYTMHVEYDPEATRRAERALGVARLSEAESEDGLTLRGGTRGAEVRLQPGQHVTADRVVSVHLHREHDQHLVPYVTIQAVTLIAAMRLGLLPALRDRAYGAFLSLPLYEDMAPWNIVFRGPALDYIDYDTRDVTFDALVPKVYQILSVLMNYKRTVQDFGRCSRDKARTPYGFSHVSDCVDPGAAFEGPCDDPALPVPCADGRCHSDYISCLRSLYAAEQEGKSAERQRRRREQAELDVQEKQRVLGPERVPAEPVEFGFDGKGVVGGARRGEEEDE